jgi:FkbM family methyltransferase
MGTTKHVLSRFPPPVEARIRQGYYRIQWLLGVGGVSSPIVLQREDDRWRLCVGTEEIYVAFPNRVGFYKFGIQPRLESLLRQFGASVGDVASVGTGDVVIDIGANIGEFSLACCQRGARVFAFEPDPDVQGALRANTAGQAAIRTFALALWHSEGELEFFRKGESADSSLIDNGSTSKVKVRACRLDGIEALAQVPSIKLLKCDAEGAEPEVLSGATGLLPRIDWLAIDCGPERGLAHERTLNACRSIISAAGFEVVEVARGGREVLIARNTRALTQHRHDGAVARLEGRLAGP